MVPGTLVPVQSGQARYSHEGNRRTVGNDCAVDDWAEQTGALLEAQALKTAADCVDETEPGGLYCERRVDFEVVYVVCDVDQDLVRLGARCALCQAVV